ncbi:MAG: PAS domain S-box protein [Betaproteobacteria bacterium]|nr:PAS domain S-box protein [Betaproteobacteria bacterium]
MHSAIAPSAIGGSALVALALLAAQWGTVAPAALIAWLAGLVLALIARGLIAYVHRRTPLRHADNPVWLLRYRVGIAANGVAWGFAGLLMLSPIDVQHQAYLAIAIAGIAAGSLSLTAFDVAVALLFAALAIAPLVALLFAQGGGISAAMGATVMLFLAFIGAGALRGYRGARDSVARRSAEQLHLEQLRRSEELLRTIFTSMGDGISVWDQDLRLVTANDRFFDIAGVDATVARPGATLREVLVSQARAGEFGACDPDVEADRRIAELWPDRPIVVERTRPDGRTIELRRNPIPGGGFVTIYVDITERKRAEAAERQRGEQALRFQSALLALRDYGGEDPGGFFRLATEQTALALRVERASIWLVEDRRKAILCQDLFVQSRATHETGLRFAADQIPAFFKAVLSLDAVVADDACMHSATGELVEDYLKPLGITSMLDVPIGRGGELEGVLCCEHVGPPRRWTPDEDKLATSIAGSILLALENARRRDAEAAVRKMNENLERLVSERTRELRESEQSFREVAEAAGGYIWELNLESRYTYASGRVEHMFGYRAEEMLGRTPAELMPPGELERVDAWLAANQRNDGSFRGLEHRSVTKQGKEFWQMISRVPKRDASGSITGYRGTGVDITERKLAEQARALLSAIVEHSSDAIISRAPDGTILSWNEGATRLYGYSAEEAIGRDIGIISAPEYRGDAQRNTRFLQQGGSVPPFETVRVAKDGRPLHVQISASAVRDDAGRLVAIAGIHRDITERKRAERAMAESEERRRMLEVQLRQSQKMEAMGTLAGGIAHDFNNIIGAILGNAALALEDVGEDHRALESITEIGKAARRARELVQQILAFSRKQTLSRRPIALDKLMEEAVKLLRATLPAGVRLIASSSADAPSVMADPTQIHQVLLNLCTNAWHAMEGRPGTIALALESVALDGPSDGGHPDLPPGRYARLTVKDTGRGMDAAVMERIFEPFFTTKPVGEGTGLGLSAVHGIVQGHEGAITVDSTPGEGTTFHLYFPAVELAAAAEAGGGVPADLQRQGRGQHVLYLDDDDALVSLVSRMLQRRGYRVSGFTLAQDALDAVRADPDGYDLAVTDFNMPGMSGLDVARELARIRPGLPVAVTSGYITDELRRKAPECGVRHLIYKPDTVDELCDVVRRLTDAAHQR